MCCVKYLTMTFPVDLPAKINNRVPANQVRFQQFRAIERFCVEGSKKAQWSWGTLVMIYNFLLTVLSERPFSAKLKLNRAFPFFLVTVREGASQAE